MSFVFNYCLQCPQRQLLTTIDKTIRCDHSTAAANTHLTNDREPYVATRAQPSNGEKQIQLIEYINNLYPIVSMATLAIATTPRPPQSGIA